MDNILEYRRFLNRGKTGILPTFQLLNYILPVLLVSYIHKGYGNFQNHWMHSEMLLWHMIIHPIIDTNKKYKIDINPWVISGIRTIWSRIVSSRRQTPNEIILKWANNDTPIPTYSATICDQYRYIRKWFLYIKYE
jgi:hypothetical protein